MAGLLKGQMLHYFFTQNYKQSNLIEIRYEAK